MTATIHDVTSYITNYIYLREYDNFGCIPQDTIPQLLSLINNTSNKFYMNPILKIS